MGKRYELLKVPELNGIREAIAQVGNDPNYNVIKKLYAYIEENGAVRSDVYEYLCKNMRFQEYSLLILNNLVKNNAGPEWFDLIKQTEEREHEGKVSKGNIRLFQQLVLEAYRDNVPVAYVADALGKARYPYEVNQRIEQFQNNRYNEMSDVMSGLRTVMEELQRDRQQYASTYGQIETVLREKDKVIDSLRGQVENIHVDSVGDDMELIIPPTEDDIPEEVYVENEDTPEEDIADEFDVSEPVEEKQPLAQEAYASEELKLFMEEMKKETALQREASFKILAGMNELFTNMMNAMAAGGKLVAENASTDEPDIEEKAVDQKTSEPSPVVFEQEKELPATTPETDQKESVHTDLPGVIVTEKRETRDVAKRIAFFQKIREKKRQTDFEKLSNTKKLETLFRMMTERNYNDTLMIMAKTCLDLDVSFEFLYTLIEMDSGEEEFRKLILFRTNEKNQKTKETLTTRHEVLTDKSEGGDEY